MSNKSQINWKSKDGLNIYGTRWDVDQAKAVILLVHGQGEHCERYPHFAAFFNAAGYSVMAYDHIGHGQSEGKRGHTPSVGHYLADIDTAFAKIESLYAGLPVFLYGHSMGGNLVLNYTLNKNPKIKGLIASAPWIKLAFAPSKFMIGLGKMMRGVYPSLIQPNGLKVEQLSRSQAVVDAYVADQFVHDKISAAAGMEMMDSGDSIDSFKGSMSVPTLLMHGSGDQITSHEASKAFGARVGNAETKIWDGLYHEIHNEPEQNEVMQYALNWMEAQA